MLEKIQLSYSNNQKNRIERQHLINSEMYLMLLQANKLTSTLWNHLLQETLVPKLTLGQFLTLSVRNGPNLQSYLFQAYISLNPSRVKQNYTIYFSKKAKLIIETRNVNFKLKIKYEH